MITKEWLDEFLGHGEIITKFEPCTCGNIYCGTHYGRYINYDRYGKVTKDTGWEPSLRTVCNVIPAKKSWFSRLFC